MTLRELLGEGEEVVIGGLAFDARRVHPGDLFFCVPGFTRDGHDFAPEAVARGAVALVVTRPLGLGVPEVRVADVRAAMARAAAALNGEPTQDLRVVGITGTNGKTTSAYLVRALLEAVGESCGLLGTVTSVVGGRERPVVRTTPEAIELQATFRAMLEGGDGACAMEVSSHALELRRVEGVRFAVAVFTNLSQDHLDFHPDMEAYFQAKRRLFLSAPGARVANLDDASGRRLAQEFAGTVGVGLGAGAEVRAVQVRSTPEGSRFTLVAPEGRFPVRLPLPGRFNVINALGAWAAARALGHDPAALADALASAPRVPGRLEPVSEGQPFTVLVDYSHKPDALEAVLGAAREIAAGGRLLVVFGAGGDRDRGKRPLMGEIVARLADVGLVTSDNPRSEDPEAIIDEIVAGARAAAGLEREVDRRAAIERALALAEAGDVVVLAGKGHEREQELAGGVKVPFDDVQVARETLRSLAAARA